MIGPSSGQSGMSGREVVENPVRVKRKVFDDLDIESLCEEVCQSGKKRFLTELRTPVDSSAIETLVDPSGFSPSTVQEVANGGGSVARLEVLVVDGTWDPSSLGHTEFTDISSSIVNSTTVQTLSDVQSVGNGYGGSILSYWEPTNPSETAQNGTNCVQIPLNPEPPAPSISCPPVDDQEENGNLSWLLDFKLDSFIEASEEAGRTSFPASRDNHNGQRNRYNTNSSRSNGVASYMNETRKNSSYQNDSMVSNGSSMQQDIRQSSGATGTYAVSDNRSFAASRYGGPKKPPFTYTELIEHALQERGELTVSAIYQWISEHFPYYKSNDDRWKNSVRHNLSINPHFRKGSKAPHGAGHLWAIANRSETRPRQLTTNGTTLPTPRQFVKSLTESSNVRKQPNVSSEIVTMDEVAAATASISQPEENVIGNPVTLEHCAEQILSGIKREVEVQYLVPMVVPVNDSEQDHGQIQQAEQTEQQCSVKDTDFLNPVSKEEVAEECGLIGESYLVTDLNPTALGLNMVEPDTITSDNLFGEELSFQFYEFTSPSQLQSA